MLDIRKDTIDTQELAGRIGIAPSTLNTWRSRGKGPKFVRIAGRIRYMRTDVENWLNDQISAA
ncbi:helix-turn-helix transcriptional regulator [Corynebacterium flavescens]|uniref:helix-turn-helix transcriptional regulator n=1 Tax=Corynebacterium flavescens TaxID=28028 RepID=UPI00289FCD6C|nr:helix-turn-helix domain-containing protein [Corynebacterium flavescens]